MKIVYLSPHLDDVVLSVGGLIHKQTNRGHDVEIWTFMTGDPDESTLSEYARQLNNTMWKMPAKALLARRRLEDFRASCIVGATVLHLGLLDCVYRCHSDGTPIYSDICARPDSNDPVNAQVIASLIHERVTSNEPQLLVCPLAIGHHVDHVIVRQGVAMASFAGTAYYADFPYCFVPENRVRQNEMTTQRFRLTRKEIRAWVAGASAYESQIWMLFDNQNQLSRHIRRYARRTRGAVLWSAR